MKVKESKISKSTLKEQLQINLLQTFEDVDLLFEGNDVKDQVLTHMCDVVINTINKHQDKTMATMAILDTGTATLHFDMEGDAYFMVGPYDKVYFLSEFVKLDDFWKENPIYDGVTHIINTGGVGIKINEEEEIVEYSFFTLN